MKACKENAFLDREQKSACGECPNAGFDTAEIYRRLIRRDIHLDLGMQVKPEHKRIGDFRRTPRLYEIEVILSAQPVACFAQRQATRMIDTEKSTVSVMGSHNPIRRVIIFARDPDASGATDQNAALGTMLGICRSKMTRGRII
jgi:hypothetical protein